jgi:hypothetical protein
MSESNSTPTTSPATVENTSETPQSTESPVETQPRKFKVKVDGQEVEVAEADLLADYGKGKSADARFREAAQMRKQAEEFIHLLRTDPIKVLSNKSLGIDLRKIAEEYLVAQLEEESLDPREKELRDTKRKLEEYEQAKREEAKRAEEAQYAELQKRFTEDYSNKIVAALESAGLPKTQHTIKRMASYMNEGIKREFNLQPADVVDMVRRDYIEETKSLYGGLDGDKLLELLGDDVATKIRKHDLAKVRNTRPSSAKQHVAPPSDSPRSPKITKDEYQKRLEKIRQGG